MIFASFVVIWEMKYQMNYWQRLFVNILASKKLKSFEKPELINQKAMDLFPSNIRMSVWIIGFVDFHMGFCRPKFNSFRFEFQFEFILFQDFVRACREMDGKYVGNRPIKLRKSNWKERNMDIVKKKRKQKQKLGLA